MSKFLKLIEPIYVVLLWILAIASIIFTIIAVFLSPYLMYQVTDNGFCFLGYAAYGLLGYLAYKIFA